MTEPSGPETTAPERASSPVLQELLARIEEQVVAVVRREIVEARPPVVDGSPDEAAGARMEAVERLVGQHLDENARTTAVRLDSLEERLGQVNSGVNQAVSGLFAAFEERLRGRLETFENHLTSTEDLRRRQVADVLEFGDKAAAEGRRQLTEQMVHLTEVHQELYGQLESRVTSELEAQSQAVADQGGTLLALGQRLEAAVAISARRSARRRPSAAAEGAEGSEGGTPAEDVDGAPGTEADERETDETEGTEDTYRGYEADETDEDDGGTAAGTTAVDERLDDLLDLSDALAAGIRQHAGDLEALRQRVEAQAKVVADGFDGVAEALTAHREDTALRLDFMSQSLAEQTRMLEAGAASADARLTDIGDGVMGATGSLIELVTARTVDDTALSESLSRVEEALTTLGTPTGDRLEGDAAAVIEAVERAARALERSVEAAVTSGVQSLHDQLVERLGPEATVPELLLAFGEAQEEAVTRALAQLGEGPLQAVGQNLVELQQATLSLIHQNEAAASAIDTVKLDGDQISTAVVALAGRLESSQTRIDGVQATLSSIVDLLEWLRNNQGDMYLAFNQLRTSAVQRDDAAVMLGELAGINTELLRHRGWLEGVSSHLHAVNDNLAALRGHMTTN